MLSPDELRNELMAARGHIAQARSIVKRLSPEIDTLAVHDLLDDELRGIDELLELINDDLEGEDDGQ